MRDLDDIPAFLRLTAAERKAAWDKNPPKPWALADDRKVSQETEAFRMERDRKALAAKSHKKAAKAQAPIDRTGMRWDSRHNRWAPDTLPVAPKVITGEMLKARKKKRRRVK